MIYVAVLGYGTVGSGVYEVLNVNKASITKKVGQEIRIKYVLDLREFPGDPVMDVLTHDFQQILDDPEVAIVAEVMGGTGAAYTFTKQALLAGKSVCTSNKALVAAHGVELLKIAREKGVNYMFEASCGGSIPIIRPMRTSLASEVIEEVTGILNGTTNYMLTRMDEDGLDYDTALAEAQAAGFAEADPSADVDGLDAAAKIAILATLAFNSRVTIDDVYTEGIRNISPLDLEAARDMGYCVKLLALAHRSDAGIDVRVHPTMIPLEHQLATVNGVYNAIYVTGDAVGDTMFFGAGAGSGPAASAVMGDVLEVARRIAFGIKPLSGDTCTDSIPLVPMNDLKTKYYIRFNAVDRPGVLAAMAGVFAEHGVSVRSVIQRGEGKGDSVDLVYITHTACEHDIQQVVADIAKLDNVVLKEPSIIRVEA